MSMSFPCRSTVSAQPPMSDCATPDVLALRAHLRLCRHAGGRASLLKEIARRMNQFVSARFVTSLALAAVVIGAASFI